MKQHLAAMILMFFVLVREFSLVRYARAGLREKPRVAQHQTIPAMATDLKEDVPGEPGGEAVLPGP
jgi:hypothetical protein